MKPVRHLLHITTKTGLMICVVLDGDTLSIKEIGMRIKDKFNETSVNRETIYRSLKTLAKHGVVFKISAGEPRKPDLYYLLVEKIHVDFMNNTLSFETRNPP